MKSEQAELVIRKSEEQEVVFFIVEYICTKKGYVFTTIIYITKGIQNVFIAISEYSSNLVYVSYFV